MNRNQFIRILCLIQGFKTGIKNIHWNQISIAQKHKTLDDILDSFEEFEDGFAEDGSTIFGSIELHEIVPIQIDYVDGDDFVAKTERFARACKKIVADGDENFAGLNALCDEFVHAMKINFFRYQMN